MYLKIETYNQAKYTLWANYTLIDSENRSTDNTVGKLNAGKLYTLVGKENTHIRRIISTSKPTL